MKTAHLARLQVDGRRVRVPSRALVQVCTVLEVHTLLRRLFSLGRGNTGMGCFKTVYGFNGLGWAAVYSPRPGARGQVEGELSEGGELGAGTWRRSRITEVFSADNTRSTATSTAATKATATR